MSYCRSRAVPRLITSVVPPPVGGPGVCETCRGPAGHPYRRCWSCELVRRRLPVARHRSIVPISLFRPGSRLHAALVDYKSGEDRDVRVRAARGLAELVAWFLSTHSRCLARAAGGGWDVLDVVPSTRRAEPDHPLSRALQDLPMLGARSGQLLRRGDAPVAHLQPAPGAFEVAGAAAGKRVLLLDDVFTTGAHALSAVAALEAGGATIVAVMPIGRLVHAEEEPARRWWAEHACESLEGTGARRDALDGVAPCGPRCQVERAAVPADRQTAGRSFSPKKSSTCTTAARVALPSWS
jgi:hypothetical protein